VTSCASTKYIDEHQAIVKEAKIEGIDKSLVDMAYDYVQKDIRPGSGIGVNTWFYNIFNTKDGKYKKTNIKPIGSPPPLLDSTLVDISREQIEKFLKSKGYFNAKVDAAIAVNKKKASLLFTANPGEPFYVSGLSFDIADTLVKSLYLQKKNSFSHLRVGMRYDEDSLAYEREEIYKLLRRDGFYDFVRPYVRFTPDSNQNNNTVLVKLIIDNPLDGSSRHQRYKIGKTDIVIAPSSNGFVDSIHYNSPYINGVRFTDNSNRFKSKPILRYDFLKKGDFYNLENEQLSSERLYELNVFKSVKIDYVKPKDTPGVVDPVIMLIPQKRMSNRIEGEIPFNSATVGFTISNTYTNNNFLKGGERFQFQIKGGLQSRFINGRSIFSDIYQRDFSVGASLAVPRLIVPSSILSLGKNGMPFTTFSLSYLYALQKDITIRRTFVSSMSYDWVETRSKLHSFTPFNLEYRFGRILIDTLDQSNYALYLRNKELFEKNWYNIALLGRKDFTLGLKYSYSLNANQLTENKSFIYFRGNVDMAGNLMSGISRLFGNKHNPAAGDYGKVFGVPFNQYIRPEVDVRWYLRTGEVSQFVTRLSAGVGYAYGNSLSIPFEKLFYAGGSSGVRAWQARTLGPGNYNREVISSPEARLSAFGLDQLGQMRIEANFEYRFPLLHKFFGGKLNGATFLDMGNIWNIAPNNPQPETYFNIKKLGQQLALGTGMGFRYDVQFFIFRFDIGLKLKDPQFVGSEQWVISKFINGGKSFKADYLLSHAPDRYRFVQYNFGIGMPF